MKLGKKKNKNYVQKPVKVTQGKAQELEQMFKEVEEVMQEFDSMKDNLNKALKTARMELDALSD